MPLRYTLVLFATLLCLYGRSAAQPLTPWQTAPLRSEFISYSTRYAAQEWDRAGEQYFHSLENFTVERSDAEARYSAVVDIPGSWLEREVFLHTEGGRNSHVIYVNGARAGSARDSRIPSEFNITPALTPGQNIITVAVVEDSPEPEPGISDGRAPLESVFIYSQPRIRIEDYMVRTAPSSSDECRITVDIMIRNGYNYDEKATIGYDVFGPDGKLQHYDMRDVTIAGQSADTLRLHATIYGTDKNMWSASNPALYDVMLFVRRNGSMAEYIPLKIGFRTVKWTEDSFSVNGKALKAKTSGYEVRDPLSATKDIRNMKKQGVNILCPDFPQPHWFYEICDREGMYVIDQANINTPALADDLSVEGTASNRPEWLGEYLLRVEATYRRSHNHPCIIGWSVAGPSGNGYNLQRAYLHLKELEKHRPVIYRYAEGQWNTDMTLP